MTWHEAVFVEHIAAGVLDAGGEEVMSVLAAMGADVPKFRRSLDTALGDRASAGAPLERAELPYTSLSKRALEHALRLARDLRAQAVTSDILLTGALEVDSRVRDLAAEAGIATDAFVEAIGRRRRDASRQGSSSHRSVRWPRSCRPRRARWPGPTGSWRRRAS